MFSFQRRTIGIEAAAIAVPVLLVYVGRMFVASPPPPLAVTQVTMPVIAPAPTEVVAPITPEQQKAAEWMRLLPPKYELASPLNHYEAPVTPVVKPKQPEEAPKVRINPVEGLKLSAVLGNNDEQLAAINGKIYHLGDTVRPGLKLTEIDPRNSRIILTDDEGTTYEIKRDQK